MAQGRRQTSSLFPRSLLLKAEETDRKSQSPEHKEGQSRALVWAPSQAAGDGWVGLSEEGKLQLGPEGTSPGDSKGDSKGDSGEQRHILSEGCGSGISGFREVKWRGGVGQGTVT